MHMHTRHSDHQSETAYQRIPRKPLDDVMWYGCCFQDWHQWGESSSFFPECDPKFWLLFPNLLLQFPHSSTPSLSWTLYLVFSTLRSPSELLVSYSFISQSDFFLTKTTLYNHPRSNRTRILKLCSDCDNGGQTRTAVFAQLHLGRLDSLEVPCGLPRSEAKWSICPVCDPSDQPQPFISPNAT